MNPQQLIIELLVDGQWIDITRHVQTKEQP